MPFRDSGYAEAQAGFSWVRARMLCMCVWWYGEAPAVGARGKLEKGRRTA